MAEIITIQQVRSQRAGVAWLRATVILNRYGKVQVEIDDIPSRGKREVRNGEDQVS